MSVILAFVVGFLLGAYILCLGFNSTIDRIVYNCTLVRRGVIYNNAIREEINESIESYLYRAFSSIKNKE